MDLTVLTTDVKMVEARKELWELMAVYTTWMEEWKQLLFCEVNHSSLLINKMRKYFYNIKYSIIICMKSR